MSPKAKALKLQKDLIKLPDMGELVVDGAVWTKFAEDQEFKVSPKGAEGDYDTGCYWVSFEAVYGTL